VNATQENFIMAESLGYTSWSPPAGKLQRSGFLTEAICHALEERLTAVGKSTLLPCDGSKPVMPAALGQWPVDGPSEQHVGQFIHRLRTEQDFTRPFARLRPRQGSTRSAQSASSSSKDTAPSPDIPREPSRIAGLAAKMNLRIPKPQYNLSRRSKKSGKEANNSGASSIAEELDVSSSVTEPQNRVSIVVKARKFSTFGRDRAQSPRKGNIGGNALPNVFEDATITIANRNLAALIPIKGTFGGGASYVGTSEKLPVFPDTPAAPVTDTPSAYDLAVENLAARGFDETRSRRAVEDTMTNGNVDFERALKKMKKAAKLEERLKRLDRMG